MAEVDLVQYGPVNVCANNENVIVPFRSQGAGLLIFDNATFGHEDPRIIGGPFQANTVDCDLGNGVVFVTETSDSAPLGRGIYPTFLISTSDPISSDLPVMNDQNLSALHPRVNDSLGIFPPEKGL